MEIYFQRVWGTEVKKVVDANSGQAPDGRKNDRFAMSPALPPPFRALRPLAPLVGGGDSQSPSTDSAACHCPACDSHQTQRVPVIYDTLTAQAQARKSGGELRRTGAILRGTISETEGAAARFTQQSQLIKRFAPPAIDSARLVEAGRSRVAVAGGGALVAFLVVLIPLIVIGNKAPAVSSGPDIQQPDTANFSRTLTALAVIALFGLPILVFAKISAGFDAEIARLRQEEWEAFDWKKQAWKESFYCHRCDAVFHPGGRAEA